MKYLPDYRHPSLPDLDVMDLAKIGHERLIVPKQSLKFDLDTKHKSIDTVELRLVKCVGGAPYTGEPFAYFWVAFTTIDGTNRYVSSKAYIMPLAQFE